MEVRRSCGRFDGDEELDSGLEIVVLESFPRRGKGFVEGRLRWVSSDWKNAVAGWPRGPKMEAEFVLLMLKINNIDYIFIYVIFFSYFCIFEITTEKWEEYSQSTMA